MMIISFHYVVLHLWIIMQQMKPVRMIDITGRIVQYSLNDANIVKVNHYHVHLMTIVIATPVVSYVYGVCEAIISDAGKTLVMMLRILNVIMVRVSKFNQNKLV